MSIETYIDLFRQSAIKKGDFCEDTAKDHKLYDAMADSYHRIIEYGEEGLSAFEELMDDESIYVKFWSASVFLSRGNEKAKMIIEKISSEDSILALTAEVVLDEYKNNNFKECFPKK